ncbi:MAG: radical SAM protein [Desulfobacterales bacterium]|nr:radical SAM protein [Desulfobacterales bacterium]
MSDVVVRGVPMGYIFGPVPSRRLGLSLGVDLIPSKTCSYDCLYCQVGRTTQKVATPETFAPIDEVIRQLKEVLTGVKPDYVTLSGSGEPTLHSGIDRVISFVKGSTDLKAAVISNGSLFWRREVREKVLGAHLIMPTLSTAFEGTFRAIHRPHSDLSLPRIIEGLRALRESYTGLLYLEVMLLAGLNDSQEEIEALKREIDSISPDRIHLNTVARPPADARALSLDRQRLEDIKTFFGPKAEVIADLSYRRERPEPGSLDAAIVEMARRRPVRTADVANALNRSLDEVEGVIRELVKTGTLSGREHLGETYYS